MTQAGADRVVWSPTGPELSAVIRAAVLVILRRDLTVLASVFAVLGVMALPLVGAASVALQVGSEACAAATDEGLRMVSADAVVHLPWSRLARPRVGSSVVAFRDTLTRRTTIVPRALFPDAWLAYVAAPPAPH